LKAVWGHIGLVKRLVPKVSESIQAVMHEAGRLIDIAWRELDSSALEEIPKEVKEEVRNVRPASRQDCVKIPPTSGVVPGAGLEDPPSLFFENSH
jgi:hypothetical protein